MLVISCAFHIDVNLADGSYVLVPEADLPKPGEEVEEVSWLEETPTQDPDSSSSLTNANPAIEGKLRFFLRNLVFKPHFYE